MNVHLPDWTKIHLEGFLLEKIISSEVIRGRFVFHSISKYLGDRGDYHDSFRSSQQFTEHIPSTRTVRKDVKHLGEVPIFVAKSSLQQWGTKVLRKGAFCWKNLADLKNSSVLIGRSCHFDISNHNPPWRSNVYESFMKWWHHNQLCSTCQDWLVQIRLMSIQHPKPQNRCLFWMMTRLGSESIGKGRKSKTADMAPGTLKVVSQLGISWGVQQLKRAGFWGSGAGNDAAKDSRCPWRLQSFCWHLAIYVSQSMRCCHFS